MPLTALPTDILVSLPHYIDNIETFINAAASCRALRYVLYTASPNTILRLAAASAPTFFSPHPYYLVTMTASQVGKWALGDEDRTAVLRKALQGGINGLYDLCLQKAGLTLADIRNMYLARFSIVNPLSDIIDEMSEYRPDIWDGEPMTLITEPGRTTFQMLIYGELFGLSMNASLASQLRENIDGNLACFDVLTRLHYITYCVPEYDCMAHKFVRGIPTDPDVEDYEQRDQSVLYHILTRGYWRRLWGASIRNVLYAGSLVDFPDEDDIGNEHWRQKLLRDAIQVQGVEGMQLITVPASQLDRSFVDKLMWIKEQVERLREPPASEVVARSTTVYSNVLDPSGELAVCKGPGL